MPIILIIVGVVAALGLGSFVFLSKPQEEVIPEAPVARVEDSTASDTPAVTTPTETPTPDTSSAPATAPANNPSTAPSTPLVATTPTPAAVVTPASTYKNGTYTVTSSYVAPSRTTHNVTTTIKLVNDVVTEARVNFTGEEIETSSQYQSRFSQSYQSEVVGKKLDSISLSRVGGASLTTGAFNAGLAQVKANAR
ncbi:MAG: hypothetical protein V4668_00770 [Patescibacteria group bacterium]